MSFENWWGVLTIFVSIGMHSFLNLFCIFTSTPLYTAACNNSTRRYCCRISPPFPNSRSDNHIKHQVWNSINVFKFSTNFFSSSCCPTRIEARFFSFSGRDIWWCLSLANLCPYFYNIYDVYRKLFIVSRRTICRLLYWDTYFNVFRVFWIKCLWENMIYVLWAIIRGKFKNVLILLEHIFKLCFLFSLQER